MIESDDSMMEGRRAACLRQLAKQARMTLPARRLPGFSYKCLLPGNTTGWLNDLAERI